MATYLLSIFVTLEQEVAVRQLFINKSWNFKKYEDAEFSEYSEVKVESSNRACANLYTPGPVRPEWTGQTGQDNYSNLNDNDLFECDNEEEKTQILTFQTNVGSAPNMAVTMSSPCGANEAMENDVITKLAEIMEDSLRNMPDSVLISERRSNVKEGSNDFLENSIEDITEDTTKQPNASLSDRVLNYPTIDDKSQHSDNYERTEEVLKPRRIKNQITEMDKDTKISFDSSQVSTLKECRKTRSNKTSATPNIQLSVTPEKDNTGTKKHKRTGTFHCVDCKYTFKLFGAFKKHKRNGKCIFECEYCGKRFTSRYFSNYKAHLKYHVKERPYKCNLCDKSYIDAQALKIHMRKHTGERPFICDVCGKSFYSSSHLVYHKNTNHLNVKGFYKCHLCSAVLSTTGNLRVHLNVVHTSERPFTCEICGKTFKTQKALEQTHAKVHQNTYPYKCEVANCEKVFKRAESLADHLRRHNNQRSHFCEKCGKGFYCNKDLQLHARTHSGLKPYSCQLCEYKCALAGNLRKHLKTHQ